MDENSGQAMQLVQVSDKEMKCLDDLARSLDCQMEELELLVQGVKIDIRTTEIW